MNRQSSFVTGGLWVAAAVALPLAFGQGHAGQAKDQPPDSGMMMGGMGHMNMGQMKMSEPMMMRCRMMMSMEVNANDPAALLSLNDQLKLTDEQADRLKAIVAQARKQADKVLTDEQKKQLAPMAKMPDSMMEMHRQMMQKMPHAKGGMMAMMCPMMEMMHQMDKDQSSSTSTSATKEYPIKGKVVAVDTRVPSVTLDHEAIPDLNMKAMEMEFPVEDAKVLEGIRVGEQVQGQLKVEAGKYVIVQLEKR